jgi:hypothetical protein
VARSSPGKSVRDILESSTPVSTYLSKNSIWRFSPLQMRAVTALTFQLSKRHKVLNIEMPSGVTPNGPFESIRKPDGTSVKIGTRKIADTSSVTGTGSPSHQPRHNYYAARKKCQGTKNQAQWYLRGIPSLNTRNTPYRPTLSLKALLYLTSQLVHCRLFPALGQLNGIMSPEYPRFQQGVAGVIRVAENLNPPCRGNIYRVFSVQF